MKTKTFRNILALALILASVLGCSKFEDGPKISFRSIIKRIYGKYQIEYFSKNGTDLTDYWNQYYNLTFKFLKAEAGGGENCSYVEIVGSIDSSGTWKDYSIYNYAYFESSDEVTISLYNCLIDTTIFPAERLLYPLVINLGDGRPIIFTITKLSNKEMWLFYEEGYDDYEIHYKEI